MRMYWALSAVENHPPRQVRIPLNGLKRRARGRRVIAALAANRDRPSTLHSTLCQDSFTRHARSRSTSLAAALLQRWSKRGQGYKRERRPERSSRGASIDRQHLASCRYGTRRPFSFVCRGRRGWIWAWSPHVVMGMHMRRQCICVACICVAN